MVVEQAQKEGMSVPGIVLKAAKTMLQRSVRKKIAHKFDPNKLSPKYFAPKCKCHALIGSDVNDGIVPPSMVQKVIKKYSKKRRTTMSYQCTGSGHFGLRPTEWFLRVHSFLLEHLYNKTKQNSASKPPPPVPAQTIASAKWPPTWVVELNETLEQNRTKANNDAKEMKKGKTSSQQGETKDSDGAPPAPSTDATEDMHAVVQEDDTLTQALIDFEETAKH
jgi:hypothetical protein|tara:strand:- start:57 stop:719 length:663 start_codon:yes stop_codon:yes gene_type:complete